MKTIDEIHVPRTCEHVRQTARSLGALHRETLTNGGRSVREGFGKDVPISQFPEGVAQPFQVTPDVSEPEWVENRAEGLQV